MWFFAREATVVCYYSTCCIMQCTVLGTPHTGCVRACVMWGVYGVYGSIYPCDVPQVGIVIAVQALLMF